MELYNLPNIPDYDVGNRNGHTDYIDYLKWNEITEPVMKGIDIFGRHFVVVKMKIDNKLFMETYFQRYTNGSSWMSCGHATSSFLETCGTGLQDNQIQLLKSIILGESIKIKDEHRTAYPYYGGKKVKLYDEKKEKAAKVIQEQWRKCRYNPKYKMCSTVQLKNLDTILSEKY